MRKGKAAKVSSALAREEPVADIPEGRGSVRSLSQVPLRAETAGIDRH